MIWFCISGCFTVLLTYQHSKQARSVQLDILQGSKALAPICFPFSVLLFSGTLTQHTRHRGTGGAALPHQACEWCQLQDIKGRRGSPRLSPWLVPGPVRHHMTCEGAHTPCHMAWHRTQRDIRTSVQPRTAPISGFSSELILNGKKKERMWVFRFWKL